MQHPVLLSCVRMLHEHAQPPIRGSPAAQEAAYVHALVHRWEGTHEGEFGTGFNNANYWYRAAGHHPVRLQIMSSVFCFCPVLQPQS